MRTFRKSQAVSIRQSGDVVWHHYRCPFCDDPSAHLGVAVIRGKVRFRCLRCGASTRTRSDHGLEFHGFPIRSVSPEGHRLSLPHTNLEKAVQIYKQTVPLHELPDSIMTSRLMRKMEEQWPKTYRHLGAAGARAFKGEYHRLVFPFFDSEGTLGVVMRNFYGPTKAITYGAKGPGHLPFHRQRPNVSSTTVLVEGWVDAAAIPFPYYPIALLGVDSRRLSQSLPSAERLIIALDGDEAGRRGASAAARGLLRRLRFGADIRIADLPDGCDPADMGPRQLRSTLEASRQIKSIKDIREGIK